MTESTQSRPDEVAEKLERVRGYLSESGSSGALFTRQILLSWLGAGLEDQIVRGQDTGFAWGLVTPDGAYIVTSNIEAKRLRAEGGVDELGLEVVEVPWYEGHFESAIGDICDPGGIANDGSGPGTDRALELQSLRLRLTAGEQDRIRALGADSCAGLEDAVRMLRSDMTGYEMAAEVQHRLEVKGILPWVLLIGGGERRASFRHPTVSADPLGPDAMVVICGMRGGLNIAATRTASVGAPDADLAARHVIACEAEARAILATRPGSTYGEALQAQIDAYDAAGYDDEWRNHTQGGPIGYGTREFGPGPLSHPDVYTEYPVETGHAVAWNPTVQGAKSEDTFLVGEDGNEMITNSDTWPSITVADGAFERPGILEVE